jgi:hypothetical protein
VESAPHVTRDGLFPSERWRAGDFIRQRFQLAIPADWPANAVTIGLRVTAADEPARIADGSTGSYNPAVTPLGSLELARP